MEELVSVIIPTYNRKESLKRAIDSVLNQTYRNIEIVIVDDCSTDNTLEYIEEHFGNLENIMYLLNEKNLGPSASRNDGVLNAKGKYISFLDSDDEWLPEKIEKQMQVLKMAGEDVGINYCIMERRWANGESDIYPSSNLDYGFKEGYVFPYIVIKPLMGMITLLMRKDIFIKVGGFNEQLQSLEDYELTINMARNYKFSFLDEVLAIAYESENSVGKRNDDKVDTQIYIMEKYEELLQKYHLKKIKFESVLGETLKYNNYTLFLNKILANSTDEEYKMYAIELVNKHSLYSKRETFTLQNISGVKACIGCKNCANICSQKAITFTLDETYFERSVIDEQKCILCGQCKTVCPVCNTLLGREIPQKIYAAIAQDDIRRESSSGGVFSLVAQIILELDGYVSGAIFTENWEVKHIVTNDFKLVEKMRGSKYLQSDMNQVFDQIRELLKTKHLVLFSGTACQVVALRSFLQIEYENLYVMDVVCHGVPSTELFHMHLLDIQVHLDEIAEISFRKKSKLGWNTGLYIRKQDGSEIIQGKEDLFVNAFLKNWILRKSCYDCKYKQNKYSDITVGDFWGVQNILQIEDGLGTSCISLNTPKGEELFVQIRESFKNCQVTDFRYAVMNNSAINRSVKKNMGYKWMLESCKQGSSFEKVYQDVVEKMKVDVSLVLMWSQNYGNALTNYALYKVIEKSGKKCMVLDNFCTLRPVGKFEKFVLKNCKCSSQYLADYDYVFLNQICSTFVLGSDQVWNWLYEPFFKYGTYFQLEQILDENKKIAYASSFGEKNGVMPTAYGKQLYSRFQAISVREKFGVEVCREKYGVEADCVIDPVFLLDKSEYQKLIKESTIKEQEPYIVTYILNPTKEKIQLCDDIQSALGNIKIIHIIDANPVNRYRNKMMLGYENIVEDLYPQDWLYYMQNSEFIITDSYHGICFSLILQKQFVATQNRESERFATFAKFGDITSRIFNKLVNDYRIDKLLDPIDFTEVQEKIEKEREKSYRWLLDKMENE